MTKQSKRAGIVKAAVVGVVAFLAGIGIGVGSSGEPTSAEGATETVTEVEHDRCADVPPGETDWSSTPTRPPMLRLKPPRTVEEAEHHALLVTGNPGCFPPEYVAGAEQYLRGLDEPPT